MKNFDRSEGGSPPVVVVLIPRRTSSMPSAATRGNGQQQRVGGAAASSRDAATFVAAARVTNRARNRSPRLSVRTRYHQAKQPARLPISGSAPTPLRAATKREPQKRREPLIERTHTHALAGAIRALPRTVGRLLPERHGVVPVRHREDVPKDRPGHAPHRHLEVRKHLGLPGAVQVLLRPDEHLAVLRRGRAARGRGERAAAGGGRGHGRHGERRRCTDVGATRACPADAIVFEGMPRLGAHATSRTQSWCPASWCSGAHWLLDSSYLQICARGASAADQTMDRGVVAFAPPPSQAGYPVRRIPPGADFGAVARALTVLSQPPETKHLTS